MIEPVETVLTEAQLTLKNHHQFNKTVQLSNKVLVHFIYWLTLLLGLGILIQLIWILTQTKWDSYRYLLIALFDSPVTTILNIVFVLLLCVTIIYATLRGRLKAKYYQLLNTHVLELQALYIEPIQPGLNIVYRSLVVPIKPITYEIWQYEQYSFQVEHIRRNIEKHTTDRWDNLMTEIQESWFVPKSYILKRIRRMTQPVGVLSPETLITSSECTKLAWDELPENKISVTVGLVYEGELLLFRP